MPTSVPDHTSSLSSHFGHLNVRWIRRRCMPSEWPRQTVTAVVARNSASAPQVKVGGPPIRAMIVMPEIQSDLTGFQCTVPSSALVSPASVMRGERNVPSAFCSASSMRSTAADAIACSRAYRHAG